MVRVTDRGASGADETFAVAVRKLPVIRSGRGWSVYSLENLGTSVPPESLRVVFDPARSDALARGTPAGDATAKDLRRR
jgi:hypothetical protein